MLVLKPMSPSRHPENGEGATFIKNNDTAFITRPTLSFNGKRREMGREKREGGEEEESREKARCDIAVGGRRERSHQGT